MTVLKTVLKCPCWNVQQSLYKYSWQISGTAPQSLGDFFLPENDEESVNKFLKHYENYPSVSKIKCNQNKTLSFDFPTAKPEDINKVNKSLNPRKKDWDRWHSSKDFINCKKRHWFTLIKYYK